MNYYNDIYIQDFIISNLERFTQGTMTQEEVPWDDMRLSLDTIERKNLKPLLHKLMIPYYEKYLFADTSLCKHEHPYSRSFMEEVAKRDGDFGVWASSQDIISATEGWGDFLKRKKDGSVSCYFNLLRLLFIGKFRKDWDRLANELNELLTDVEVNSDYKTGELYCILHATVKIWQKEWDRQKKQEVFELLCEHWYFMKLFYSVMIRRIVGTRLANFAALTNNVIQTNAHHPHAQIYYCALSERMESFGLKLKQYKSLDDARLRLLNNVVNQTKPSEVLYELCDTLFPEEFQVMLQNHRPPSYSELKNELSQKNRIIAQMESQAQLLQEQSERLAETYRKAIEASIPVDDIKERLLKLSVNIAWEIYGKLDHLLKTHPNWRKYDIEIHGALEAKEQEERKKQEDFMQNIGLVASRPNITNFNNQGTYNDNSGATIHPITSVPLNSDLKMIEQ